MVPGVVVRWCGVVRLAVLNLPEQRTTLRRDRPRLLPQTLHRGAMTYRDRHQMARGRREMQPSTVIVHMGHVRQEFLSECVL